LLERQLEAAVRFAALRRRCVAIGNMTGNSAKRDLQCVNTDTVEHNGRLLCWVHRKAAENPARGPLRFVGDIP
jgi:hypothetical protein